MRISVKDATLFHPPMKKLHPAKMPECKRIFGVAATPYPRSGVGPYGCRCAAEYALTLVKPALVAVILTNRYPWKLIDGVNVVAVAFEIAALSDPSACVPVYHWYANATDVVGDHVPVWAVSFDPAVDNPVIEGTPIVVNTPAVTGAVGTLVLLRVV
jgi:hypothetical protein